MQKEWVWIRGYEGKYEVNEHGIVRSYQRSRQPRILKPYPRGNGNRSSYGLCIKGKRQEFYAEDLRKTYFGAP